MQNLLSFRALPISIHALREEGDLKSDDQMIVRPDFYPRPP